MSIDFVVHWQEKRPTNRQLRLIVEDFFGESARVAKDGSTLLVSFAQRPSQPFTRIVSGALKNHYDAAQRYTTRGLELWPWRRSLSITLRRPDEFSLALAEGLAKCLGRFYKAAVDLGS